jgi:hypothetical protein
MRVTIIPEDKWIRKDEVSLKLPEWNFNDSDIHAIQWYEDHGEIEWKNPQRNESITEDSILQPYITALEEYLLELYKPAPEPDPAPNDTEILTNILNS